MTILVSNANGKVGQEVAKALLAKGEKVRSARATSTRPRRLFPSAEIVELDLTKPATLAAAVKGVDAVFSATPYELLPAGEEALIGAAKSAGVKRYVKLSAKGVEANPASPHVLAEKTLATSGLAWTILRPTFFMQNYSTMSAGSIRSGAIYEPAGQRRLKLRRHPRHRRCRGRGADEARARRQRLRTDWPRRSDPRRSCRRDLEGDRQAGRICRSRRRGAAGRHGGRAADADRTDEQPLRLRPPGLHGRRNRRHHEGDRQAGAHFAAFAADHASVWK